ncbi:helicase HerA domain-containing protein [Enterococcus cecorum]|uniref:helicase HerA domain-containing protein n=1 Tax=Enterococcus cecorum TaxID=44008 RepID=UPI00148C938C|nr:DUF87 domain-containing protein [Enterococcus cecorum]
MAQTPKKYEGQTPAVEQLSFDLRMKTIDSGMRHHYLTQLSQFQVAPLAQLQPLEEDIISNIRLFKITEMVYHKGEPATDKFTTVFNTLSTFNASVFILMDSDGQKTDFYLGVRNNENDESPLKRSTVTLGDTLKNTLIGHFPGVKIENRDRKRIAKLSHKMQEQSNLTSVSVIADYKQEKRQQNAEYFLQGLEKLALSMQGRQYIGLVVAQNQSPEMIQTLRENYQDLYSKLSPLQKVQVSTTKSEGEQRAKKFTEMDTKQKAATISSAGVGIAGTIVGAVIGNKFKNGYMGAMIGSQIGGQLATFINSLAPVESINYGTSESVSETYENKRVTEIMKLIDEQLERTNEFDSYGMWNVAAYFMSDDMSDAEIAASNYRSLMNGENTGREVSAINSWRKNNDLASNQFDHLLLYLSRFSHPQFIYHEDVLVDATTSVTGKELGLHLGLPRATVPGLPVIEHAEFGKEVHTYRLFGSEKAPRPEDSIVLGKVFDLGQITNKKVELDNKSLNMHTFITGSTGSGKSNTVYQILSELHQDKIPFLVVEPAKGEYKDVFGNWPDVRVFSTNPKVAPLIHINPFRFPESIHVLEHVDGLVEIFSACWPMYDAMPAFFKDAILRSYEEIGWDLGSSTFDGEELLYPDFEILTEQLDLLIEQSDYASDIKSNYRGALITRVKSLTVGLNKFMFTQEQTPYEQLFDQNCILDISRVKSRETKALIMGLIVYILNEYRMDQKQGNNQGLRHVTVLEEAHNLLKNSSQNDSELIGKSVEMISSTIAEIRTYGEGFIIVDQSPSSVDISAIKNTNAKIVLRTPEANDRQAVGHSIGLTEDQVNEIAKLPSGVAVVYQNDWLSPVLTMIDKANVQENTYVPDSVEEIINLKTARTNLITMLLSKWIRSKKLRESELYGSLDVVRLSHQNRNFLKKQIDNYMFLGGKLYWDDIEFPTLIQSICNILDLETINNSEFISNLTFKTNFSENTSKMISEILRMEGE